MAISWSSVTFPLLLQKFVTTCPKTKAYAKRNGAVPHDHFRRDLSLDTSGRPATADPHSHGRPRRLRHRQLFPSSSMRHRCRLSTTGPSCRCCCSDDQYHPHEVFSSPSSRWHTAPAGRLQPSQPCAASDAVRHVMCVMLSVHLRCVVFCYRCRELKSRFRKSNLEFVILQGSMLSPY